MAVAPGPPRRGPPSSTQVSFCTCPPCASPWPKARLHLPRSRGGCLLSTGGGMVFTSIRASMRPTSELFPQAGHHAGPQDHSSALTLRLHLTGETGVNQTVNKSVASAGGTGAVTGTEELALELSLSCGAGFPAGDGVPPCLAVLPVRSQHPPPLPTRGAAAAPAAWAAVELSRVHQCALAWHTVCTLCSLGISQRWVSTKLSSL